MGETTAYLLRAPRPQDARALGEVHCAVWRASYDGLMSLQAYQALQPEVFVEQWKRWLTPADRPSSTTVLEGPTTAAGQEGMVEERMVRPGT